MQQVKAGVYVTKCFYCDEEVVSSMYFISNAIGDRVIRSDCPKCGWPLVRIISCDPNDGDERTWQGVSYTKDDEQ